MRLNLLSVYGKIVKELCHIANAYDFCLTLMEEGMTQNEKTKRLENSYDLLIFVSVLLEKKYLKSKQTTK
jgi:hypothetical protein